MKKPWMYSEIKCKECGEVGSKGRYTLDEHRNYCDKCELKRGEKRGLYLRIMEESGLKLETVKDYVRRGVIILNEDGSWYRQKRKVSEPRYELIGVLLSDISSKDELSPTQPEILLRRGRKVLKGANYRNYGCNSKLKKTHYRTGSECWNCGTTNKRKNLAYCDDCFEDFKGDLKEMRQFRKVEELEERLLELTGRRRPGKLAVSTYPLQEGKFVPKLQQELKGFTREELEINFSKEEIDRMKQLPSGNYLLSEPPEGVETCDGNLDANFEPVDGDFVIDKYMIAGLNRGYVIKGGKWA